MEDLVTKFNSAEFVLIKIEIPKKLLQQLTANGALD